MHFLDGHEGVISSLGNGNRNVPHEKLMSIDMRIIQILNCGGEMEFLGSAEMCTIVTLSARQSPWCYGEVAPQLAHLVLEFLRWYNLRM